MGVLRARYVEGSISLSSAFDQEVGALQWGQWTFTPRSTSCTPFLTALHLCFFIHLLVCNAWSVPAIKKHSTGPKNWHCTNPALPFHTSKSMFCRVIHQLNNECSVNYLNFLPTRKRVYYKQDYCSKATRPRCSTHCKNSTSIYKLRHLCPSWYTISMTIPTKWS